VIGLAKLGATATSCEKIVILPSRRRAGIGRFGAWSFVSGHLPRIRSKHVSIHFQRLAALLADDSDANLLVWADWLEDQGDPACEGVREFLVGKALRPERELRGFLQPITFFSWTRNRTIWNLRLRQATRYGAFDATYINIDNNAEAHHRALYDLAYGYATRDQQHPKWQGE
jgi:uncharacterized protein (TIGR02996 family)